MSRLAILREPKEQVSTDGTVQWENPLVPHSVLRQMYEKMMQARLLEEHVSTAKLKTKNGSTKGKKRAPGTGTGQEACRVAVVQGLVEGDLVAEAQTGPVMAFLLGAELSKALNGVASEGLGAMLPFVESARDRLNAALGATMALRAMKSQSVVVVYIQHSEADTKVWKHVLSSAARLVLPMIFVVLPTQEKRGKGSEESSISKLAKSCRLPGIAVDGGDAIALYRVAQESLGRVRGGGGPVLIECVTYRLQGKHKSVAPDPLEEMRKHLLDRGAAQKKWLDEVEEHFPGILLKSQREADRRPAR